jgi:hypothetical protein
VSGTRVVAGGDGHDPGDQTQDRVTDVAHAQAGGYYAARQGGHVDEKQRHPGSPRGMRACRLMNPYNRSRTGTFGLAEREPASSLGPTYGML